MLRQLLLSGAECYLRMSSQALLGNEHSLLVQLGLLGHVPYLRDYYRPENQQGDRRRNCLKSLDRAKTEPYKQTQKAGGLPLPLFSESPTLLKTGS